MDPAPTVFSIGKRSKVLVALETDYISLENSSHNWCWWRKPEKEIVPIEDILSIVCECASSEDKALFSISQTTIRNHSSYNRIPVQDEQLEQQCSSSAGSSRVVTTSANSSAITIHYMKRKKNHYIWTCQSKTLKHPDPEVIWKWRKSLDQVLKPYLQHRPKNLFVVINPYGGKKRAKQIFREKVCPIFDLVNINYSVIETEYANHAQEIMLTHDFVGFDGVISVGGDGIFNECFNGLLRRAAEENSIDVDDPMATLSRPALRVGVVPGGSTDSVALGIHGCTDPVTAALHIALGDHRSIDVSSIFSRSKLQRFSMTMASYGYFGDLIRKSESHRWMGPKRYDWSGFHTFMANKSYRGELTFVKDEVQPSKEELEMKCTNTCEICANVTPNTCEQSKRVTGRVQGKFMTVTGATLTCCSHHTALGVSPGAHLSDGNADLILVKKTNRFNYLRYLFRVAHHFNSPFDLPYVEVHRVREFTFSHMNKYGTIEDCEEENHLNCREKSSWNIDGEILNDVNIRVKVHCQLVQVFARGPEDRLALARKLDKTATMITLVED